MTERDLALQPVTFPGQVPFKTVFVVLQWLDMSLVLRGGEGVDEAESTDPFLAKHWIKASRVLGRCISESSQ